MVFVDQLFDIDAAQHKLLSIDSGKSRFSGHAVVAHIRSLPTPVNFAMTLLARCTISSRLPVPVFPSAVREQLEEAFQRCGVPEGMLMDHGTPWWSQQAPSGQTHLSLWLMRQGIRLHWSGIRHPQTQGKVERFHGSLQRAWERRGLPQEQPQVWLDAYRWEHNYIRPHEALGMQTPATVWRPSLRRYDPHPPRWEYPAGAWVLKLDCHGLLDIRNRKWKVSKALAGERVQVVRVEDRMMVFYCTTLLRELDPGIQRSKIVERWIPRPSSSPPTVKDV
jgi:hypothetical protein